MLTGRTEISAAEHDPHVSRFADGGQIECSAGLYRVCHAAYGAANMNQPAPSDRVCLRCRGETPWGQPVCQWCGLPAPALARRQGPRLVGLGLMTVVAVVGIAVVAGVFNNGLSGIAATPVPPYADLVATARSVAYDELLRDPGAHDGELVRFANTTVIEVISPTNLILSTRPCGSSCWDDPVSVTGYQGDRLFENDVVELIGTSRRTTRQGRFPMPARTIPRIDAASIRVLAPRSSPAKSQLLGMIRTSALAFQRSSG